MYILTHCVLTANIRLKTNNKYLIVVVPQEPILALMLSKNFDFIFQLDSALDSEQNYPQLAITFTDISQIFSSTEITFLLGDHFSTNPFSCPERTESMLAGVRSFEYTTFPLYTYQRVFQYIYAAEPAPRLSWIENTTHPPALFSAINGGSSTLTGHLMCHFSMCLRGGYHAHDNFGKARNHATIAVCAFIEETSMVR